MGLFNRKKQSSIQIKAPINGNAKNIEETPDPVFAQRMMGDGIIIEPMDGKLVAPVKAEVSLVFPTLHAVGLKMEDGTEILLHFGLETVSLNGEGFKSYVEKGQIVNPGDLLIEADLEYIKQHAVSDVLIMVFTTVEEGKTLAFSYGNVTTADTVVKIE
jgi:glucose-specific phosphotransferase system IIA component